MGLYLNKHRKYFTCLFLNYFIPYCLQILNSTKISNDLKPILYLIFVFMLDGSRNGFYLFCELQKHDFSPIFSDHSKTVHLLGWCEDHI